MDGEGPLEPKPKPKSKAKAKAAGTSDDGGRPNIREKIALEVNVFNAIALNKKAGESDVRIQDVARIH